MGTQASSARAGFHFRRCRASTYSEMFASQIAHLETFGFAVLRGLLDPAALSAEFDASMRDGFTDPDHMNAGAAGNKFRYVPTMCERTPVSLALVTRLSSVAAELLGASVLPVGQGDELPRLDKMASRHRLGGSERRLRVLPRTATRGRRRAPCDSRLASAGVRRGDRRVRGRREDLPGIAVPTVPGDAIVFDEHLYHGSAGGGLRRQWRVDFVADTPHADDTLRDILPASTRPDGTAATTSSVSPATANRRTLDVRWNEPLEELGAYHSAAEEEAFVRVKHR